jgi:heme exporter protein B
MRILRQILLIASKDLRIEARSRQTVGLVVVLGILIVSVLGLGLGQQQAKGVAATAVLWVAYLFAGVLCFEKTMAVERQDGALAGLLLAPLDRGVIYVGKLLSNVVLMFAVAAPLGFLAIIAISMLGFAAVGTLFSAMVSSSRLQGGLLAMVVFPITLPLVIASTQMTQRLYQGGQTWNGSAFAVLVAFDVIFLVVSWLTFEWVIEP